MDGYARTVHYIRNNRYDLANMLELTATLRLMRGARYCQFEHK